MTGEGSLDAPTRQIIDWKNPDFADPGTSRPSYAGRQPVRNGDVANLAASLLGLDAVPGSGIDAEQDLTVKN